MTIIFLIWKTAGAVHHGFELQMDWQLALNHLLSLLSAMCALVNGGPPDIRFQVWKVKGQAVGFCLLFHCYLYGFLPCYVGEYEIIFEIIFEQI